MKHVIRLTVDIYRYVEAAANSEEGFGDFRLVTPVQ
jgi:hypothetical protein